MNKKKYTRPTMESYSIVIEDGIVALSASISPTNQYNVIEEEWIQDDDDNRFVEW